MAFVFLIFTLIFMDAASISLGRPASENEEYFPYQAFLSSPNDTLFCGGIIINPYLVLTAAHCIAESSNKTPNEIEIIAGITNGKDFNLFDGIIQARNAWAFHIHESYDELTRYDDIALIQVKTPFHFNSAAVKKISLPLNHEQFQGSVIISRYNTTLEKANEGFLSLKNKKHALVQDLSCKGLWHFDANFSRSIFCAKDAGLGVCERDSGSPAICFRNETSEPILCGIAKEERRCEESQKLVTSRPRLYTKVSDYVNWIENKTQQILSRMKCSKDRFYCHSKSECIPRKFMCDHKIDCPGGEDQDECEEYNLCENHDEFSCADGSCVKKEYVCDGTNNCDDGSDEDKCMERGGCDGINLHFCGYNDRCIPMEWKCDGMIDCNNASDERKCSNNNGSATATDSNNNEAHIFTWEEDKEDKPGKIQQWWNKFKLSVRRQFMFLDGPPCSDCLL